MNEPEMNVDTNVAKFLTTDSREEQGYDAPFANFTWQEWLEQQAKMLQRFTRFQRAIQYKQARVAVQIAQEVIQMGMEWLDEASGWIGIDPE